MKFGQVTELNGIDFRLPPLLDDSTDQVGKIIPKTTLNWYIGTTSWNNKEWLGSIYPKRIKQKEMLSAYGQQFNSIELNSTHYGIPDMARILSWCEQVPDDFKFSPKFPQTISHRRDLGIQSGQLQHFLEVLADFQPKIGMPFIQFPHYINSKEVDRVFDFLQAVHPYQPIAIELRNKSFYEKSIVLELKAAMKEYMATWVCTDTPGERQILHSHVVSDSLFVRMVGCGDWNIDQLRIDQWCQRFAELQYQGLTKVYFYLHDPDQYTHANMAIYLHAKIKQRSDWIARGPVLLQQPIQGKLF